MTVHVSDPVSLADRWGQVLGVPAQPEDGGAALVLDEGRQCVRFVQLREGDREGISEFYIATSDDPRELSIAGVTFSLVADDVFRVT